MSQRNIPVGEIMFSPSTSRFYLIIGKDEGVVIRSDYQPTEIGRHVDQLNTSNMDRVRGELKLTTRYQH
jgi:hypothetical protein